MEYYNFILKIIKKSGALLLSERDKGFDVESKNNDQRDVVTDIDRKVNDFIVSQIRNEYPGHSIYSEEGGDFNSESEFKWAIDPIDGTANFSRGIPHFSIVIGLLKGGIPITGAVYNPITRELYSFKKGKGAFLNKKRIHVSNTVDLSRSHVFFHAGRKIELRDWGGESYRRLLGAAKKTNNFASSSLDMCFVAAGKIEASIYGTLSTNDIVAAIGILNEAGGIVTTATGESVPNSPEPQKVFAVNNTTVLNQLRDIL